MLKQFIKISFFISIILMISPVFADDSELLPEAVPGDDDQQQIQADIQPSGHAINPKNSHVTTHSIPADETERPLSLEEEHIIQQDQAQFETELNTLHPGQNNNPVYTNEASQLEQDRGRLQRDAQLNNKQIIEEDDARVKADKRALQQYSSNSHQADEQQEPADDSFFNPGAQEQQNLQKYQMQEQYRPGARDW